MKNANKIMLAGAVALGLTAIANTEASADTYTVRQGDTVWGLAQAHNVSISDIDAVNPNINVDTHLIIVGDTINLPDGVTVTLPSETTDAVATQPVVANEQPTTQEVVSPVVTQAQPVVEQAPVAPQVQEQSQVQETTAPVTSSAKDIIAGRESGGDYNAQNGRYQGKYQLDASYLNGDYSPANQERVADNYVAERYGSWDNALAFWNNNGWY